MYLPGQIVVVELKSGEVIRLGENGVESIGHDEATDIVECTSRNGAICRRFKMESVDSIWQAQSVRADTQELREMVKTWEAQTRLQRSKPEE